MPKKNLRTWRDIPQAVSPQVMSRAGRRRRWFAGFRLFAVWVVLAGLVWGGYAVWRMAQSTPVELLPGKAAKGEVLRMILLKTDGVLSLQHIEGMLAIPAGTPVMELDLDALHARLLQYGQIRGGVLQLQFPDTLVVKVEERTPVLRVAIRAGSGQTESLCVARDGVVYRGRDYDAALLSSLPYLDGVRLVSEGSGFRPIDGMDAVADLLGTALSATPVLYKGFRVVSLARYASDGEILVRSVDVEAITFGTREDFYRQLSKLDLILDELRRSSGAAPIKAIDLAVGGRQVPVSLTEPQNAPSNTRGRTGRNHAAPSPSQSQPLFRYSQP